MTLRIHIGLFLILLCALFINCDLGTDLFILYDRNIYKGEQGDPRYTILKMAFDDSLYNSSGNTLRPELDNSDIICTYAEGVKNTALVFPNTNGLPIQIKFADELSNLDDLYISFWLKKDNTNTVSSVIECPDFFLLTVGPDYITGNFNIDASNFVTFRYSIDGVIQTSDWHKYEMIYNGTSLEIKIGDSFSATEELSGKTPDNPGWKYIYIGREYFVGLIDELEIYTHTPPVSSSGMDVSLNNLIMDNPDD